MLNISRSNVFGKFVLIVMAENSTSELGNMHHVAMYSSFSAL
jgi:hypothetical protein